MTKSLVALMLAHSFYSPQCCSDKDCRPVPCDQVKVTKDAAAPEGEIVTWHEMKFYRIAPAPDGGCHVCTGVSGGNEYPICAYKPVPLS